jgi:hypothetical protein
VGKFTLVTTLCTLSPNKVAPCLVSSASRIQEWQRESGEDRRPRRPRMAVLTQGRSFGDQGGTTEKREGK